MKIVKFRDGTFAIRKGWFKCTYRYLDYKCTMFHRCKTIIYAYCTFDTYEKAKAKLDKYTDYGTPV